MRELNPKCNSEKEMAIAADCLETLEELAIQNRELFLHEGGKAYAYIPALNDREDHIRMLADLVMPHLRAFWQTANPDIG